MTDSRMMTTNEVADRLGITVQTLYKYRRTGKGPAWHKLEGGIRYDSKDIESYLQQNRVAPEGG